MTKNKIKDVDTGDILTFKASDSHYKVIFCVDSYRERSPFHFTFGGTTIDQTSLPTIDEVINCEFYGIGNRKSSFWNYKEEQLNKNMADSS